MTAVLFLLRAVILILLWSFVIAAIFAVRSDVFGSRRSRRRGTAAAASARPTATAVPAPAAPQRRPAAPAAASTPPPAQPTPRLVVVEGSRAGETIALTGTPVTIGRAPDSTLVLTDDYASTRHARVTRDGSDWVVEDLGSTNGTYVGRQRITAPTRLRPGSTIRIGKTAIELRG